MKTLIRLIKDESGTETLEWGLVCGLIVVGAITAITLIGPPSVSKAASASPNPAKGTTATLSALLREPAEDLFL